LGKLCDQKLVNQSQRRFPDWRNAGRKMHTGTLIVFVLVVMVLFVAGIYYIQRRFWTQDRNNSPTAPPAPPEGVGNDLKDKNPIWRPPRAG